MKNEYWLKYGFKDNGELTCVRMLSSSIPDKSFFYIEDNETKEVMNTEVIKLTKEVIDQLSLIASGAEK